MALLTRIRQQILHVPQGKIHFENFKSQMRFNVNFLLEFLLNLWNVFYCEKEKYFSPQKVSPGVAQGRLQSSPAQLFEADHLSDESDSPDISIQKGCEQCETHRQRVVELEQTLEAKRIELKNTRELMRRIGVIAGSLLESCTDFDKQWVTHSRKVYSQIQSVICNME